MSVTSQIATYRFGLLIATIVISLINLRSASAADDDFHRNPVGEIRLATPPFSKSGKLHGNRTIIGKRIQEVLAKQAQKIYVEPHENEITVIIVVQDKSVCNTVAVMAIGELMKVVLDSDIDCGSVVIFHNETWELVDVPNKISKRKFGPRLVKLICNVSKTGKGK